MFFVFCFLGRSPLFGLNFAGVNILIPSYIETIKKVLHPAFTPAPPVSLRVEALNILTSLVCFPRLYASATVPDLATLDPAAAATSGGEPARARSFLEYKDIIASAVFGLVKEEPYQQSIITALWSVSLLIFEELNSNNPVWWWWWWWWVVVGCCCCGLLLLLLLWLFDVAVVGCLLLLLLLLLLSAVRRGYTP